jgi:aryl-alcohol dehydrogenase-like predicted oxidoreductase
MDQSVESIVPRRPYQEDVSLSIVGMGGIVLMGMEQPEADRTVTQAIERGVNYFDVAPSYGEGEAEEKLGPALEPHREGVFLACKTHARDAKTAREHLETSLKRLRTDHFDLYQFHGLSKVEEVEQILSRGGAGEVVEQARRDGKIRFIGCSAHDEDAAALLMDELQLDSVLFPLNFACVLSGGFGPRILEHAARLGVARLALKAMAHTQWSEGESRDYPKAWYKPVHEKALGDLALRFALSQKITSAIPPGDIRLFNHAVDIACRFERITQDEVARLQREADAVEPIFRS